MESSTQDKIIYKRELYNSMGELIFGNTINGYVDLRGIYLTENQLRDLQDFIYSNRVLRELVTKIAIEDLTFVNSVEESSLSSNK